MFNVSTHAQLPTPEQRRQHSAALAAKVRLGVIRAKPIARQKAIPKPRDILLVTPVLTTVEPCLPEPPVFKVGQWKVIIRDICKKYEIHLADLMSIRRDRATVRARHEAMYRMRVETTMSMPEIGRRLGGRDHTTVLHGIKQHTKRMEAEQP